MARCVGTHSGEIKAAVMTTVDVVVGTNDRAELRFRNGVGEVVRKLALEDQPAMLDLAHQLISAHQLIQERKDAKVLRQQR